MGWACALTLASTLVAAKATVKDLEPTGPQPQVVLTDSGKPEPLYKASHALLISAANYQGVSKGGWEPLPATAREMDDLAGALRSHGFSVRRVSDPDAYELRNEIRRFVAQYGREPRNRVVIFFSGHGHTDEDTQKGYIVPVDALDPYRSSGDFFTKAMPIEELNIVASELRARHALFLFDSCFSGSVFQTRSNERVPTDRRQYLRGVVEEPVRQMIAAGRANEKLPGRSIFTPLLIDLLRGKRQAADDEYLTGRDIGRWLMQNLPSANPNQHPHSGYVPGRWDLGDMVFQLRPVSAPAVQVVQPVAPAPVVPAPVEPVRAVREPLSRFRDCDDETCPWMVVLPAGSFLMGSRASEPGRYDDEGPQHRVQVASFAVGQYEVTFRQWDACVAAGGCTTRPGDAGWGRGQRPVMNVSWDDAQQYVKWLSGKTGQTYRLPSEAEWEYAARAGTSTPFAFGKRITTAQANFDGNYTYNGGAKDESRQKTLPVGSLAKNAWGLYDMHGNVWEWVQDCSHPNYQGAPTDGQAWTAGCSGSTRLLRGGGWDDHPGGARSAFRNHLGPSNRFNITGFRLARMLP